MDDRSPDSSLKPISKYDIRQYHNYSSINSSSKPNKDTSIDCSQRKRTGIKLISTLSNPRSI